MNRSRTNDFLSWDHTQIALWIFSLENGSLLPYKEKVEQNLKDNNVTGTELLHIEMEDINAWGIDEFVHVKLVYKHIKSLVYIEGNDP